MSTSKSNARLSCDLNCVFQEDHGVQRVHKIARTSILQSKPSRASPPASPCSRVSPSLLSTTIKGSTARPCTPIDGLSMWGIGARDLLQALDVVCDDQQELDGTRQSVSPFVSFVENPLAYAGFIASQLEQEMEIDTLPPRYGLSKEETRMSSPLSQDAFISFASSLSLSSVSSPRSPLSPISVDTSEFVSPCSSRSNSPATPPQHSRRLVCPGAPTKKKVPHSLPRQSAFRYKDPSMVLDFTSLL
mmetsp:Transcript_45613/g.74355  ORF Transcript_45613/g.74355 Transcript_45613/m.74355 type:complete len:246 (-) Transcript_45613:686-1423(-)